MRKNEQNDKTETAPADKPDQQTAPKWAKQKVVCGFCHNTVLFERVKPGQKIACPKCNFTLEIK